MEVQIRNETNELRLLFEVCQALEGAAEFSDHLEKALRLIAKYTGMMRGALTLVDTGDEDIIVEATIGLTEEEKRLTKYKMGESITGRVIQAGEAAIVPNITKEPLFLNRTGAKNVQKDEIAFICAPITIDGKTIGALSADCLFADSVHLEEDMRLLHVLASLFARAVRIRREFRLMHSAVVEENRRLQALLRKPVISANLVGASPRMNLVLNEIAQVSESNATVLIQGESGTGKELVAGIIHANSSRMNAPFVKVNCAALPEGLIESELFGHEKGAFTGAYAARKGRFEQAHGGTLFLDEVGDMPPMAQAKLLRVLQEKEFERVGGSEVRQADVRVIAATNRDLEDMVQNGLFRQDLYYRLSVFPIHLPALRERREDIAPLTSAFMERFGTENKKKISSISTRAADLLMEHPWPGNIRELENAIQRAVLLCGESGIIEPEHLPPAVRGKYERPGKFMTLAEALADVERRHIVETLDKSGGNMAKAAAILGITERIMGLRMKKYGLDFRTFRRRTVE